MIKKVFPPVHPEGYGFAFLFFVATVILWHISVYLGFLGLVLTVWCLCFFRNPERVTPDDENLIICPADGVVQQITTVAPPAVMEMGDEPCMRISIFMNVFNVHINRSPVSGILTKIFYHPGKFLNASLDKASEHNERQSFVVKTKTGMKVGFVQIAGLIARRIRCDVKEGDTLLAGERFGLIRFGSRVDVYLPKTITPLVIEGQITVAGETILADIKRKEKTYKGVVR